MQSQMLLREREIGVVTHYWGDIGVAGIHLTAPVNKGDHIHIVGHTSNFEQDVDSMEIDHHLIQHGSPGDDVGLRVAEHAREHDKVYKMVSAGDIGKETVIL